LEFPTCEQQDTSDGPDMVSTGSRVSEWTTRQAIDVNEANIVIANDEYYALAA